MDNKRYTVAIVGCGKRGRLHAEMFFKNDRFQVAGLCDTDRERLQAAAPLCGNPELFDDASKMLESTRPDIFCFCTPPAIRLSLIRLGVENNVKLVAYEKPMATNFNEAAEIMKICREAGAKTVLSHQIRYGEHFRKVKEIIDSGALGRIHTVYGHVWGWYLHMVTHVMDFLRYYNSDAEAEWVIGQVHGRGKLADNHPSPEYAGGFIQFANNVRGIVEIGAMSPDVPEVEYPWHKGRIGVQGTGGFAEALIGGGWRAVTRDSCGVISGPGKWDALHDQPPYINDIALWLDGTNIHPCNGESAYKGFEITMALLRSAIERRQIKIPLNQGENEIEALARIIPE